MIKTLSKEPSPCSSQLRCTGFAIDELCYRRHTGLGPGTQMEAVLPWRDSGVQTGQARPQSAVSFLQGSTEEGELSQSESRWEGFSKEVMSSWTCENESLNQVTKVRGEVPASGSAHPPQAISVLCCLFWSRNFAVLGFRACLGF